MLNPDLVAARLAGIASAFTDHNKYENEQAWQHARQVAPGSKATRSPTFTVFTFDPTDFRWLVKFWNETGQSVRTFAYDARRFMPKNLNT